MTALPRLTPADAQTFEAFQELTSAYEAGLLTDDERRVVDNFEWDASSFHIKQLDAYRAGTLDLDTWAPLVPGFEDGSSPSREVLLLHDRLDNIDIIFFINDLVQGHCEEPWAWLQDRHMVRAVSALGARARKGEERDDGWNSPAVNLAVTAFASVAEVAHDQID